jgi:hypothetical protein
MSLALPKAQGKRDDLATTSPTITGELKPKSEALADAGASTSEAHRAEKLAKKSKEAQEAHVAKASALTWRLSSEFRACRTDIYRHQQRHGAAPRPDAFLRRCNRPAIHR